MLRSAHPGLLGSDEESWKAIDLYSVSWMQVIRTYLIFRNALEEGTCFMQWCNPPLARHPFDEVSDLLSSRLFCQSSYFRHVLISQRNSKSLAPDNDLHQAKPPSIPPLRVPIQA
jgi:hypothetical protein